MRIMPRSGFVLALILSGLMLGCGGNPAEIEEPQLSPADEAAELGTDLPPDPGATADSGEY